MLREFATPQFVRFLIAGGIAAAVNVLSRVGFSTFLSYPVAIVLAYGCGMVTAFLLMKRLVFESGRSSVAAEVAIFSVVNALALAQTFVVSLLLAYVVLPWLGVVRYREEIAHVIGVAVPIATSFLGHKHGTFRSEAR